MRFLSCDMLHLQSHLAEHIPEMCVPAGAAGAELQLNRCNRKRAKSLKNIIVTLCRTPPAPKNTTRKGRADSLQAPGLAKLGAKLSFPCLKGKERDKGIQTEG